MPPAVEAWSLNHWSMKEVLEIVFKTVVMVEITKDERIGRERQMTESGILQCPEAW